MEKNNRNQNSILLMVVGVVFIAVSGILFATTAWKILPWTIKQILLLLVTVAFFLGARRANQNHKLKKTEAALYYLGIIFTGLLGASIFGEWGNYGDAAIDHPVAWKLFFANLVMIVPTCIRFIGRKKWFDYVALVTFGDAVILFGTVTFEGGIQTASCLLAGMVILLSIGDYVREYWIVENNEGLKTAFFVSYIIHIIFYIWLVFVGVIFDKMEKGSGFLLAVVLMVSTLLIYKRKKNGVIRVCNSIAIMWTVYAGADFINSMASEDWELSFLGVLFVAYVVNVMIAFILFRKELLYTQIVVGVVAPYIQLIPYSNSQYYFVYQEGMYADIRCLPFTFVMVIACIPYLYKMIKLGKITWETKGKTYAIAAGLQAIAAILMLSTMVVENVDYKGMVRYLMLAFVCLAVALFQKKDSSEKCMLQMFALLAAEFAAFSQPIFVIPDMLDVEWLCLLLTIGVVVLRIVWYHKKKIIEMICFILTCFIMLYLLMNSIVGGELVNVMILGITGVVMLLVGTGFNNRKYAVLATIVLLTMVVYITRHIWLSIAWWVYLFAAGVILVLLAIKKESES